LSLLVLSGRGGYVYLRDRDKAASVSSKGKCILAPLSHVGLVIVITLSSRCSLPNILRQELSPNARRSLKASSEHLYRIGKGKSCTN